MRSRLILRTHAKAFWRLRRKLLIKPLVSFLKIQEFKSYLQSCIKKIGWKDKYIVERYFGQFVEACVEETIVVYVDHLFVQKNYISEETIERMKLDEVLVELQDKVESRVRVHGDLRELASSESLDSFTLAYTNILEHQPDCPPEVVEKLVRLRDGIRRKDAKEVVRECKKIYEDSLVDGNTPKAGFVFSKVKNLECFLSRKKSVVQPDVRDVVVNYPNINDGRSFKWYDYVLKMNKLYNGTHLSVENVSSRRKLKIE